MAKLRSRLAEVEQTLEAIQRGQVDALVVQDEQGERIYSLTGAEVPYRMLIEQMQEGVVTVDTAGQILYANARFAGMIGLPLERVIGEGVHQFVVDSARQAVTELVTAGSGTREMEIVSAGGMATPGLVSATRLEIGGVSCVGLIVTDLTPQKHHEQRLALLAREQQARAEAEAANRAKDEFLAILSHELRTPLNAIFGWARMLRGDSLAPRVSAHAVEVIERNALVQVRMIDDLLDISRIISGKMHLDMQPVEMASIVAAAVESIAPSAQAKQVAVESVVTSETEPIVADAHRVQQVVWNLLSNAIKFTPAGGRVRVELGQRGDAIELSVSDSGEGIDAALLPYIFDRFRQGDSTSTREHGGLGIGLALVRHLTELHGGSVRAESAGKAQGATFVVRLPVARAQPSMAGVSGVPEPAVGIERLRGLRVIVVDDDRDTVDLLEAVLRHHGMEVRGCTSALDAFEVIARWDAQLLISDIQMPEMDGYALLAGLRTQRQQDRPILAIALTAASAPTDVRRAHDAGFDVHIGKPFEPSNLVMAIEKLAVLTAKSRASGPPQ